MKILLVNNRYRETTEYMAGQLAAQLRALDVEVAVAGGQVNGEADNSDMMIVLGGDGTILRAARQYGQFQIPLLGVNMGTVGFLSNIEIKELDSCLQRLLKGDYTLDQRMMLEVSVFSDNKLLHKGCCLNEMVFRSKSSRLLSFILEISGQVMEAYRGDGIIIATPTGSTAYSLSAGGPVVDPELEAFIVTPIASHIISKKPLVVAPGRELNLTPLECREALISIDGQVQIDFEPQYRILIKKAPHQLKLINLKNKPFFKVLEGRL